MLNLTVSTIKTTIRLQEISKLKEGKDIHRPELHRYVDVKIENEAKEFQLKIMSIIKITKKVRFEISG